jgi:hypothetical protein
MSDNSVFLLEVLPLDGLQLVEPTPRRGEDLGGGEKIEYNQKLI